ncbi:hypothetical protein B0H16DRAFT_1478323 [Mycena metata]|uniref:Uncharacterized protein n=1 Tax=Mycena metata TaxID=1033252 RepID=A0AAD7H7N3_9AGAR|nr:hypothetical protein B0H16DRAFT_1478323 [Mycena metata]
MSCGRLLTGEALKAPQDLCARFKLTRIRTLQKYFGLTMGLSDHFCVDDGTHSVAGFPMPIRHLAGQVTFDSDTQHARARARGQQCANLVLTLARPVDNDLRPGESLARSGRSPPLLTSDPWTIGDRDSLAEAFHLDLSLAREQRPPAGRISSREESIFLHRNAVSLITARQSSSPIPACSNSSVAPSPTPCRLDVRPSHGTAPTPPHSPPPSPHRHPASTAFTRSHPGALMGLPRPPGARSLPYDVCGDPPSLPLPQARSSLSRNFDLPDVPRA